jgi:hypothetical protein
MRLAGKICCACRRSLDPDPFGRPGERYCDRCSVARSAPKRVYLSFFHRAGWHCQFLEEDLRTPLPRTFTFATPDKVVELIRRAGGLKDLAAKQAVDHAIENGRGGLYLSLTADQYAKLGRSG